MIVRDSLERVVKWVAKFKEVGDIAVQYDPSHASLPWAGVRLLLQVGFQNTPTIYYYTLTEHGCRSPLMTFKFTVL